MLLIPLTKNQQNQGVEKEWLLTPTPVSQLLRIIAGDGGHNQQSVKQSPERFETANHNFL